ncbi:protein phosphatase 2C domain-containing protein [Colibacter massiliensis]|uniref:protein phosphatase 2C domain-containing protein n=1 Tax=Colibacter massiliensis TaxID=1852379 RepID=UPI00094E7D04|nr:PP2C family serine/threonine-protein phosphatase [Colibacter massiliensis]
MGIYGESRIGLVRSINEDSFYISENGDIMAVADGMGGYIGGEIASRTAVNSVAFYFANYTHGSAEQLKRAALYANDCILSKIAIDPSLQGMGTTLSVVAVADRTAYWAHVGDSRIYILPKGGALRQISTDHTVIHDLLAKHRITAAEAETHPQRHVLTRAVGVERELPVDGGDFPVAPGDRILLCSDGLTGCLDEKRIAGFLADTARSERQIVKDLFALIYEEGAPDNGTVILKTV